MRKLTRKQILARLFVGFFTLGSLLCTVNSAVAGGGRFGEYKIEHSGSVTKVASFTNEVEEICPTNESDNTVTVNVYGSGSGTTPQIWGGGSETDDVNNNKVTITTAENTDFSLGSVLGANVGNASATNNAVSIYNSKLSGFVYGGWVRGDGNVASNSVTIDKGITASSYNIAGGLVGEIGNDNSKIGNATNNKVEIKNGSNIDGKVYGGYVGTGSATQNIVNIGSSTVNNYVYGGYVYSGSATENKVDIASSTVKTVYGGYVNQPDSSAAQNKVHITDSKVNSYVYGGFVGSASSSATLNEVHIASSTVNAVVGGWAVGASSATENKVDIASSTVANVFGGYSQNGNAESNTVEIRDNSKTTNVYGGYVSNKGNAESNTVILKSGSEVTGIVYGGYTKNGNAASNTIEISDSTAVKVYGGYVDGTGSATQNIVDIASSTINGGVWGGYVKGTGSATENKVAIANSTVDGSVFGGYVYSGSATQNIVNIASSTAADVHGGCVEVSGNATQNIVDIAGSTVNSSVYGGRVDGTGSANSNTVTIKDSIASDSTIYGGYTNNGDANSNTVEITNSKTATVWGGYIKSESATGNTNSNTLKLTDSEVYGNIVAAYNQGTGDAVENTIEINGGTIGSEGTLIAGADVGTGSAISNKVTLSGCSSVTCGQILGGFVTGENGKAYSNAVTLDNLEKLNVSWVAGGYVKSGDAVENIVRINDGSKVNAVVSGADVKVIGGYVHVNGKATNNRVELNCASSVNGSVYGGYVGGNGNATDNTVEISGGSTVSGSVYGGKVNGTGDTNDARTGNKLIISGAGNKIGGSVENFEYVSFKLASDDDTSKSMLSVLSLDAAMDLNLVKLDTELPESGLNGERTLIDGNTLNYATATYTIKGIAVDGDKSLTFAQKNDSSVNVGFYKYVLSESAIKLNAESTIVAAFQQSGKDPLSTDDRKIVVTSEMANKYSRIYGAFNADGKAATNATVELSEAVNNENLAIYGGYSTGSGVDVTTGNTLEVAKSGNKLKNILNFEKINFFTDSANNQSMLTLAADTVDLSNTYINVQFGDAPLADGQTVTLLDTKQLSLSDKKLTINDKTLDANMSLKLAAYGSDNKYVNVGDYSMKSDDTKLSITANESFLTSKYTNGNESLAVEKFELTNDFSNFKAIYGSYSADNSAAEGGKLSISQKVDLSKTTLIGGKSAGNGEVKNNTLEISSAGSKVKGLEKFDNFKFTLAAGMSGSTPMLSTKDKILLDGATIDTDLSNLDAADDAKLVFLDNTEGKAAKRLLNGKEGNIINAKKNEGFVAISSVGYSADEDKLAIDIKSEGAAGCFIDENGQTMGNNTLTLGSSAASNMRAGYERASEGAPDMSKYSDIYGVYSAGSANPTGATIEIVSAIDYSNTVLHGGYKAAERAFYAEGNTLRVKSLNSKVKGVTDFETMEFDLPAETKNGDTMLKVADAVDMAQTKTVVEAKKATGLKAGDSVNLIDSEVGIQNFDTKKYTVSGLTDKTGEVKVEDKALVLALDENGEKPNKNTKAPVEAISATMALVNQASALASSKLNKSMTAAVASANGDSATFASMNGGHSKYETGSYVEADSWNIGVGIAKKGMSKKNPDTTYGLFFQYGKSSFDTHNDGGFRGDGDSKMFGAGLMFHQEARSRYYYHGNVFAGKVDAKWNCAEGGYDDKATYYGMTFGMGRKHNAGGNKTMDIYGRYSFNHVGSMNGDLNGLKYDFDSTSSHNLRLGLRMEYSQKNAAKAYWGLAWEHEFAGDSKATVATLGRTDSPTLNGNTGIAEVGYEWKRGNWEYNINAEGSFGKREGVTGSFNINYNF